MNIDFQAFMVFALIIIGAIWFFDVIIFAPRRRRNSDNIKVKEPLLVEYARSFFPIILIVLILRSFLVEPFRIPSGSMIPTLLVGDFILVNKYTYGIRLPLLGNKIIEIGKPQRGDVVVFRYPKDPSLDYIKRVIGVGGDVISYREKSIFINGEKVPQVRLRGYTGANSMMGPGAALHLETIGSIEHNILLSGHRTRGEGEFIVPKGHYFVMGDNRDNSNDSRFWGFVPEENLVGKAFLIWLSWDSINNSVLWDRIGTSLN